MHIARATHTREEMHEEMRAHAAHGWLAAGVGLMWAFSSPIRSAMLAEGCGSARSEAMPAARLITWILLGPNPRIEHPQRKCNAKSTSFTTLMIESPR